MFTDRHVVTCFVCTRGRLLLLKRSSQANTYQDRWTAITGSVPDESVERAFEQIRKVTGIEAADLYQVRSGRSIEIVDQFKQIRWNIYPYLFSLENETEIELAPEFLESEWVDPRRVERYKTVPMLSEALSRVWDSGYLGPQLLNDHSSVMDEPSDADASGGGVQESASSKNSSGSSSRGDDGKVEDAKKDRAARLVKPFAAVLEPSPDEPSEALSAPSGSDKPSEILSAPEESEEPPELLSSPLPEVAAAMEAAAIEEEAFDPANTPEAFPPIGAPPSRKASKEEMVETSDEETIEAPDVPEETADEEQYEEPGDEPNEESDKQETRGKWAYDIDSPDASFPDSKADEELPDTALALSATLAREAQPATRIERNADGTDNRGRAPDRGSSSSASASPGGVRVKVLRTIEVPKDEAKGETRELPPQATGRALLEDPVLSNALLEFEDNEEHGSLAVTRHALDLLPLAGERSAATTPRSWLEDLRIVARELSNLRPSLAGPVHAAAKVLYELDFALDKVELEAPRSELHALLNTAIARVTQEGQEAAVNLAAKLGGLIPPAGCVMTFSYSQTVLEGLKHCEQVGIQALVLESRPRFEGRQMARAILAMGRNVTLLTDAAVGIHIREADLAIVGATALLADGSIIYKTGAYPLALAAKAAKIPLYVTAPLERLDLRPTAPQSLIYEEKEAHHVWPEPDAGIDVRNVYFERIPRELISGIVTEDGLLDPSSLAWEVKARAHLNEALYPSPPVPPEGR